MTTYLYRRVGKQSGHAERHGHVIAVAFWGAAFAAASSTTAMGQGAWIDFEEDPSRIVVGFDPSGRPIINDLPCNPTCTNACVMANTCQCACEKDIAVGDLDGSLPELDDLIIVRKQPMMRTGGVSNLLFMNESGTMVERTAAFAPCMQDPTQDRDVVIVDVNFDINSSDNFVDVITAPTFGEHPRQLPARMVVAGLPADHPRDSGRPRPHRGPGAGVLLARVHGGLRVAGELAAADLRAGRLKRAGLHP